MTSVNLQVEGKPIRKAVGSATKDAANKKIRRWVSWDVSELHGKSARIQMVDGQTGG
ncbi:MAG: fructan beta-fructosidase [Pirellulaceae bacterium]|jgi:fructan beta-fructosidase